MADIKNKSVDELYDGIDTGQWTEADVTAEIDRRVGEKTGERPTEWADRFAGAALGASSGAYGGLVTGGPAGALIGGGLGGVLGGVFPPKSMTDVAMTAIPQAGAGKLGQLASALGRGKQALPQMGNIARAGVRTAQGVGEGLAEHAAYETGRSLEAGQGIPSGRDLLPKNLWDMIGVGGAIGARAIPDVTSRKAFMESPGVQTEKARGFIGGPDLARLPLEDTVPDALDVRGQQRLREQVGPNEAALRAQQSQNKRAQIELKSEQAKVQRQQEKLVASLENETKRDVANYEQEMKVLAGDLQMTTEYLKRQDSKISGLKTTAREKKPGAVAEYVARNKNLLQLEAEIATIEDKIGQLERGRKTPTTRLRELGAQKLTKESEGILPSGTQGSKFDISELDPDEVEALRQMGEPGSLEVVSPTTGDVMSPYTTHEPRFAEKIDLFGEQLDADVQISQLKGELAQYKKLQADEVARITREATERYLTINDPAIQAALKERATLRTKQTKQRQALSDLEIQKMGAEEAGRAGKYTTKYKSVLNDRFESLTDEITESQLQNEFINQQMAELGNSPNTRVRQFAWAVDPEARWKMIANGEEGFETARQTMREMSEQEQGIFRTWFYERLARALNDPDRELLSNYSKVFGEKGMLDPRTLSLFAGSVEAGEEMRQIFARIEKGNTSFWEKSNFAKKASSHLAYHTAVALLFYPSKVITGAAAAGTVLVGTTWPKMFHALAEKPELRREMMQMMEDGGGSINARAYPILSKWIFENAHPVGIEDSNSE